MWRLKINTGWRQPRPMHMPCPPRFFQQNRQPRSRRERRVHTHCILFHPRCWYPVIDWLDPAPRAFPLVGRSHLLGVSCPIAGKWWDACWAPLFGRRIILTLVGPLDAVIADGVGGTPDFTSTAASETPNECTELGQVFLFSGTYHCRHAMDDPWGACAEEEEGGWPASIGIPPDEYRPAGVM